LKEADMQFELVVVRAFAGRVCGEVIRAVKDIASVLSGEHAHHVVKVKTPESQAAQPVTQQATQVAQPTSAAAPAASSAVKAGN
jgi:phosphatidate phosphatase APP1